MRYLPAILLLLFCLPVRAQNAHPEAWQKDLDYIKTELPRHHPDFFFKTKRAEWENKIDYIKANLANKSDAAVALDVQQAIAAMGDDHTQLDYTPLFKTSPRFPFKALAFADGYFVLSTIEPYQKLIGKKILAIDNLPIDSVEKRLSLLTCRTNDALIKDRVSKMLADAGLLFYFGVIKGNEAIFKFQDANGKEDTVHMLLQNANNKPVKVAIASVPLYLTNERTPFWSTFIKEKGIVYMQYNLCDSKEVQEKFGSPQRATQLASFTDFSKTLLEQLKQPGVKKFVLDMRLNPGGSSLQGKELAAKVAEAGFNKKGKTFVIIGRHTFSSAVLNALDFQELNAAIIVGEEASGKPNHYGQVDNFKLPNTGLNIECATKALHYSEKDENSLLPEVKAPQTFADFVAGKDVPMQVIEKY